MSYPRQQKKREYLKESNVQQMNETKTSKRGRIGEGHPEESGSIRNISEWLNTNGEVMSIGKISEYLKVYDNLDRSLLKRTNDFMELNENIVAIENYLNNHKEILHKLRDSRDLQPKKLKHLETQNPTATASDISFWIDKKTEEVISHDVITQNLNIYHKLDEDLRKGVETATASLKQIWKD